MKKSSREIDIFMASEILGHGVFHEKTGAIREQLPTGQTRPLRSYSEDIAAAWEIVEKLGITLLPVENGWFALVGDKQGWSSPADFIRYLQKADFVHSGAALGEKAPMTICIAAMKAHEHRNEGLPDDSLIN
ncbi:MAG TPA: hypothetical protein VFO10_27065 [Oligoflexus sp.]|uniref:BC1872 family protein n=1 Tax=Oligoflexus sp. TaxID=1971216 RepID=UPI002D7F7EFB|nr:hypothetical protein [Oligoflexus sp.]HET9240956.1 hypothetical protein [Oligoflexus sp.]